MDEQIYTIILSNGTVLSGLTLNGNNFVSPTEVTEATFAGKLDTVTITDGETTETLHNAELVQIAHYDFMDGWYFILQEIPPERLWQMGVDKSIANDKSIIGGARANRPYAVGEYLTIDGTLYRVALPILVGGFITPGTNVEATDIATELSKLNLGGN